jgi:hypothetical protein
MMNHQVFALKEYAAFVSSDNPLYASLGHPPVGATITVGSSKGPFYLENLQLQFNTVQQKAVIFMGGSIATGPGANQSQLFPQFSGTVVPAGQAYAELVSKILASAPGVGVAKDPCGNPAVIAFGLSGGSVSIEIIRSDLLAFEGASLLVLATGCVPKDSKVSIQIAFGSP